MERAMNSAFHIAIDGPVAAGKGTVSKLVAERLNFAYIDTGAMYRMTAYLAKQHNTPLEDEVAVAKLVADADMDIRVPAEAERDGRLCTVVLDGQDVSWKIRTEEISSGASIVAQHGEVRAALVRKQQDIAKGKDVVMEGRDITYRVLPHAQLKVYLTADDTVRAKRRHLQLQTKGQDVSLEEVYQDLIERDKRDMERSVDPLQIVDDAWVLNSSVLSIEEVVELIVAKVKSLQGM
jgi:cytidylate kinase